MMNSTPDEENLVNATKEEMEYYRIVRTTLHGLDGIRLNASIAGLTLCGAFIGTAITAHRYLQEITICHQTIHAGYLFSFIACLLSTTVGAQFIKKIDLFNHFIKSSVDIADKLEQRYIQPQDLRLTYRFNQHHQAGKGGDKLFIISLLILTSLSIIGAISSLILFITHIK